MKIFRICLVIVYAAVMAAFAVDHHYSVIRRHADEELTETYKRIAAGQDRMIEALEVEIHYRERLLKKLKAAF